MIHERSTCSIGWPSPRSVANEKAATISARRTPELCSPMAGHGRASSGPAGRCGLWGEPPTTASRGGRTFDAMATKQSEAEGRKGVEGPDAVRWSAGGRFLEALAARDFDALAAALEPGVRFRALLPRGADEWSGAAAVAGAFQGWFGAADDFELLDATIGEIGGRLHISWRARVRPAPNGKGEGWHVIEQQAYADA